MDQFIFWKNVACMVYPTSKPTEWDGYGRTPTKWMLHLVAESGIDKSSSYAEKYEHFNKWYKEHWQEFDDENMTDGDDVSVPTNSTPQIFYSVSVTVTQHTIQGLDIQLAAIVDLTGIEKRGAMTTEAITSLVRLTRYACDVNGLQPLNYQAQTSIQGGNDETIFRGIELFVSYDDKRREKSFKVRGGEYQKFGVVVYPEVMAEGGYNTDSLSVGDVIKLNRDVVVKMADGKPVKIIRFL